MKRFGLIIQGFLFVVCLLVAASPALAQGGAISGTVTDPQGGVVANATVTIHNPVSQYERSTTTGQFRHFQFPEHSVQSLPPFGIR